MKIGDKVTVIKSMAKKDKETCRETKIGYIHSVTHNLIVIMYTDGLGNDKYKESFNIGNLCDGSAIIKTKEEVLNIEDFRKLCA